jgi:hypothetical protein
MGLLSQFYNFKYAGFEYYWLLRADSHLTRRVFRSMLRSIATLQLPMG